MGSASQKWSRDGALVTQKAGQTAEYMGCCPFTHLGGMAVREGAGPGEGMVSKGDA